MDGMLEPTPGIVVTCGGCGATLDGTTCGACSSAGPGPVLAEAARLAIEAEKRQIT